MRFLAVLLLSASIISTGCEMVNDMKSMFENEKSAKKAIKEKHGLQSQISWHMNNGELTYITVTFLAEEVRDKRVAELEAAVKEAVAASFKLPPRELNVNISCDPIVQKVQTGQ